MFPLGESSGSISKRFPVGWVAGVVLAVLATVAFLSASLTTNLVRNGSFERGDADWSTSEAEISPGFAQQHRIPMPLEMLEGAISFDYLPEDMSGELAKGLVAVELFGPGGQQLGRMTYVLTGETDYWSNVNGRANDISYMTTILETEAGEWNPVVLDNPLAEFNRLSAERDFPVYDRTEIVSATLVLHRWAKTGPAEMRFRRINFLMDSMVSGLDDRSAADLTPIKKLLFLPSEGRHMARTVNDALLQTVPDLKAGSRYLLLFDAKNETGVIPPTVRVVGDGGDEWGRGGVTMQLAQSGWVRKGFIFTAQGSQGTVEIGVNPENQAEIKYGVKAVNHFDRVHLVPLSGFFESTHLALLAALHDVDFGKQGIRETPLPYEELPIPESIAGEIERAYAQMGVPVLNLTMDERQFWTRDGLMRSTEFPFYTTYGRKMPGGYGNMFPAELEMEGRSHRVRVKTRGRMGAHHLARNKSLRINFSKTERIDLLRPESRHFLLEAFSNHLADRLGLIHLRNEFVFLRINGKPIGAYWAIHRNQDDLELSRRPEGMLADTEVVRYLPNTRPDDWQLIAEPKIQRMLERTGYAIGQVMDRVNRAVKRHDAERFSRLVDVDRFLQWEAHNLLVVGRHQAWHENNLVYFNTANGKVEWVPWDVKSIFVNDLYQSKTNPYMDFVLTSPKWYTERSRILWDYVSDYEEVVADISHYKDLMAKVYNAFENTWFQDDFEKGNMVALGLYSFNNAWKEWVVRFRDNFKVRIQTIRKSARHPQAVRAVLAPLKGKTVIDGSRHRVHELRVAYPEALRYEDPARITNSQPRSLFPTRLDVLELPPALVKAGVKLFDGDGRAIDLEQDEDSGSATVPLDRELMPETYFDYLASIVWRHDWKIWLESGGLDTDEVSFIKKAYKAHPDGHLPGDEPHPILKLQPEWAAEGDNYTRLLALLEKLYPLPDRELTYYLALPAKAAPLTPDTLTLRVKRGAEGEGAEVPVKPAQASGVALPPLPRPEEEPSAVAEGVEPDWHGLPVVNDGNGVYRLPAGEYELYDDLKLPAGSHWILEAGVQLMMGPGVSILSRGTVTARGTPDRRVLVIPVQNVWGWGSFVLLGPEAKGDFAHCRFDGGNAALLDGAYFSGMVAVHYAESFTATDCDFSRANRQRGDDGLNVKYGLVKLKRVTFTDNRFDAADFDYVAEGSSVIDSRFISSGNDALDISGSKVLIQGVEVKGADDKGISLGEESEVRIVDSRISGTTMALAVKDFSRADVFGTTLEGNRIGVAVYNKKRIFGGAHAKLVRVTLNDNEQDFGIERIHPNDPVRFGLERYRSTIDPRQTPYRKTGSVMRLLLRPAKKKNASKKVLVRAFLRGDLEEYRPREVFLGDGP